MAIWNTSTFWWEEYFSAELDLENAIPLQLIRHWFAVFPYTEVKKSVVERITENVN